MLIALFFSRLHNHCFKRRLPFYVVFILCEDDIVNPYTLAGFFGILNVYFCRINLSMAVVDMIGKNETVSSGRSECPVIYTQYSAKR